MLCLSASHHFIIATMTQASRPWLLCFIGLRISKAESVSGIILVRSHCSQSLISFTHAFSLACPLGALFRRCELIRFAILCSVSLVALFSYSDTINLRGKYTGGHVECQYALMSFGIPPSVLGVDHEGNIKKEFIMACIKRHSTQDVPSFETQQVGHNSLAVDVASNKDVLLGRGLPYQTHPGNIHLSKLIEERQDEYNDAPKFHKTVITWEIVKRVQEEVGGRFLEKDESLGTWKICSNDAARLKVAYGFRSRVKMQRSSATSTATKTKCRNDVDISGNHAEKRLRVT